MAAHYLPEWHNQQRSDRWVASGQSVRTLARMPRYTLPGDTTVILNQLDKPNPANNETVLKVARGLVSVEVKRDAGQKRYIVFGRIHKPLQIEYVFIAAPARSVSEVRKLVASAIRHDP